MINALLQTIGFDLYTETHTHTPFRHTQTLTDSHTHTHTHTHSLLSVRSPFLVTLCRVRVQDSLPLWVSQLGVVIGSFPGQQCCDWFISRSAVAVKHIHAHGQPPPQNSAPGSDIRACSGTGVAFLVRVLQLVGGLVVGHAPVVQDLEGGVSAGVVHAAQRRVAVRKQTDGVTGSDNTGTGGGC